MTLLELAVLFEQRKHWMVVGSGLSKDALHIYTGLAIFLIVRIVWRWRGGWLMAWMTVLAIACGGEWLDLAAEAREGVIKPDAAHWHDIWNTLFWPTVLLLVGRWLHPVRRDALPVVPVGSGEGANSGFEQP